MISSVYSWIVEMNVVMKELNMRVMRKGGALGIVGVCYPGCGYALRDE